MAQKKTIPVCLITTLYNEEQSLRPFLESLNAMTVLPAQMVIVDGGSTDGSLAILESFKETIADTVSMKIIVDATCSTKYSRSPIAKGRNVAIQNSDFDIIAATDAGCIVSNVWLEEITKPLLQNEQILMVGGWYQPLATSYFERCQALIVVPPVSTVDPKTFLPSSRSIAFRKELWKTVGGYPELTYTAEDTLFDLKIRQVTQAIIFNEKAVVFWRMRPNLFVFIRMNYRYGFGEGVCRCSTRNIISTAAKLAFGVMLIVVSTLYPLVGTALLVLYAWLLPFNKNIRDAFRVSHLLKYPAIAILKIVMNNVYIAGYLHGRFTAEQPQFIKLQDSH
ncbi:MAG: glycosyltransferase [Bacteriovoracaceae bacterium]|nr:glycosyltransferase [Bacteroidota bacterium]